MILNASEHDHLSLITDRSGSLENADLAVTPFQSNAWIMAWKDCFAGSKVPLTLKMKEGNDCVGEAALYLQRSPWRVIRWAGTGLSDYLQPTVRKGYEELFAKYLFEFLTKQKEADFFDLHQVNEHQPLLKHTNSCLSVPQAQCGVIDLEVGWDHYLKTLSKSLRTDIKRLEKEPFLSSKARIWTATKEEIQHVYDILFYLHGKRWRRRGLPGVFLSRKHQQFHRLYGSEAVKRDQLRLNVLEIEDQPIGVLYAMKAGFTTFFYQCGFDPEYKSLSPGTLLIAYTIRQAIEEGQTCFDFLRGIEPYKLRWQPTKISTNYRLLLPLTSRGKVGVAWNRFGAKAEAKLREKFEGRGLLS